MLKTLLLLSGLLPFSLPDMTAGKAAYNSDSHKNGVFVIEAFFDGCHFCHENAPNVRDLEDSYKTNPRVQILDVGVDSQDVQYQSWILQTKPSHPVLKDNTRRLIGKLGTRGFPSTYVIDCNGDLVAETSGAWGRSERNRIREGIEKALQTICEVPPEPGDRNFSLESESLLVEVILRDSKMKIEEAKSIVRKFMD